MALERLLELRSLGAAEAFEMLVRARLAIEGAFELAVRASLGTARAFPMAFEPASEPRGSSKLLHDQSTFALQWKGFPDSAALHAIAPSAYLGLSSRRTMGGGRCGEGGGDAGLHTVRETVFILLRSRANLDNHHHVHGELTGVAQLLTPTG